MDRQWRKALSQVKFGEQLPRIERRGPPRPGETRSTSEFDPWWRCREPEWEREPVAQPETDHPLTAEAVAENPWVAALYRLPANASPELLEGVKAALHHCRDEAADILSRLDPRSDRYQRDRFDHSANMDLILGRLKEMDGRLDSLTRDESHPTLTLDAIRADPWNAVSLPLPEKPSLDLLDAAADGARAFISQACARCPARSTTRNEPTSRRAFTRHMSGWSLSARSASRWWNSRRAWND